MPMKMPRARDTRISYSVVQAIAVFYLAIWAISPPLMIGDMARLLALACAVIWFALALVRGLSLKPIHCAAALFTLAVIVIAYVRRGKVDDVLKMIPIYMLVIGFVMAHFYKDRWHELKGLVPILLILCIIWNSNTVKALIEDPLVARMIVRDDEAIYEYLRQGIGGYELIYPQVCVWPAMVMWTGKAFQTKRWVYGVMGVIWGISYVWMLFLAGYSIAICASLLGLVALLFYRGKGVFWALIGALALFITGALLLLYVPAIGDFLCSDSMFGGTAVADKIEDLRLTGAAGDAVGSIESRVRRYSSTIRNLVKYPIIGSLWIDVGGGHSAILDTFLRYGWWGGSVYVAMLLYVPNWYKKWLDNSVVHRAANAVLVSLVFVTLLDSVTYSFAFMITVVLSMLYEDIAAWDQFGPRPKRKKKNPYDFNYAKYRKTDEGETEHTRHRHRKD